jgi:hypothetical protein
MAGPTPKVNRSWADPLANRIPDPVAKLRYLRNVRGDDEAVPEVSRWRRARLPVAAAVVVVASLVLGGTVMRSPKRDKAPEAAAVTTGPAVVAPVASGTVHAAAPHTKVWLVETRGTLESWSNGLQVDTSLTVSNKKRKAAPTGIVFHTTESQMDTFEPEKAQRLKILARGLLNYVREEKGYHYVIDRFGRAFRIVAEDDVAYHAGNSVWGDEKHTWTGLNDDFLAVSLESATRTGDENPEITPAQKLALRLMVEMLRYRFGIAARNCVTHAQVSVNPSNFRVGWHTDWAGNFPFEEIGLPDNYQLPLAAVERYGFGYDPAFFAATGARMWRGVVAAEDRLRAEASRRQISVAQLRAELRKLYYQHTRAQDVPAPNQIENAHKETH